MTDNSLLQAQKASLAQQQRQLADQLATTRESSGRQEAGQITLQSIRTSLAEVADLLVFSDTEPPSPRRRRQPTSISSASPWE
jgi:hypothetical protein